VIGVFAYGTLRDPAFQTALFGRTPAMRPATLRDWMPAFTESGYLTIVPAPGDAVLGDLVALERDDLFVADAWEEVPLYVRALVEVATADGASLPAWVYVRPSESRERAPDGVIARLGRAHVLAQIRAFRATSE
jgi:gamma-glutamylcyclotransferase (GGCT)/AIG2-like uncharacterized protein YtfP